jgi:RNA polymerase sigma-70 factor, ECF subfamily
MDGPDSGQLWGIHDEHAAALRRYALLLTGNRARAAEVVQESMLRARREPEVAGSPASTARAWLFTVARNMVIDEQGSAGFSNAIGAANSVWPDSGAPEDVNAAVDRLLLADALAQLPADHRAVVRCAYYQGRTTAQIAADLHVAEETVKASLHDALWALLPRLREMGIAPQ